ncbi:MAG: hypothetical protein WC052_03485 [Patescibacteria group bacterium]|jgi:hypothetical protein
MKKKYLVYAFAPVIGLSLFGASAVSARGMFGSGFSFAEPSLSADEVSSRQQQHFDAAAKLLGVSADVVKDAWADGKSIADIATAQGLTDAQLKERIQAAQQETVKQHLATLVSKGVITQAQSDKRLAALEKQVTERKGKTTGRQHGRMMGGMGGGLGW